MPRRREKTAVDEAIEYRRTVTPEPKFSAPREEADNSDATPRYRKNVDAYNKTIEPSSKVVIKALMENEGGLLDYLDPPMQEAVMRIRPEFLNLDEEELKKKLAETFNWHPSQTAEALRINFWHEFDRVQIAREMTIVQANIVKHAASKSYWEAILNDPLRWPVVAWIICRPMEYDMAMRTLLNLSTRKLRDILMIPVTNNEGQVRDAKTLDVMLKAAVVVDHRVKGSYVQHTINKTLQINHNTNNNTNTTIDIRAKPIAELELHEIQARLKLIDKELEAVQGLEAKNPALDAPICIPSDPILKPKHVEAEVLPMDMNLPNQKNAVKREFEV